MRMKKGSINEGSVKKNFSHAPGRVWFFNGKEER